MAKREEFWHTAPAFEGKPEIWTALKATVDALEARNYQLAQAIIDSANIILPNGIINDCYDELGNRLQSSFDSRHFHKSNHAEMIGVIAIFAIISC